MAARESGDVAKRGGACEGLGQSGCLDPQRQQLLLDGVVYTACMHPSHSELCS